MDDLSFESVDRQLDLLLNTVTESASVNEPSIFGSKPSLPGLHRLDGLLEPHSSKFSSLLLCTFTILSGKQRGYLLKSRILVFYKPKVTALLAQFLAVKEPGMLDGNNKIAWRIIDNCLQEIPKSWFLEGFEPSAMMFELILIIIQSNDDALIPNSVINFMLNSIDIFLSFDCEACIDTYLCVARTAIQPRNASSLGEKLCLAIASCGSLERFLLVSHASQFSTKLALIYDSAFMVTTVALAIPFESFSISTLPHRSLKELCNCLTDRETPIKVKEQVSESLCLSWLASQSNRSRSVVSDDLLAHAVMAHVSCQDAICYSAAAFLFVGFFVSDCGLTGKSPYESNKLLMGVIKKYIWKPGKQDVDNLARFISRSEKYFMPWIWEQYSDNMEAVMDITLLWLLSKPLFSDQDLNLVSSKSTRVLLSCLLYICSETYDIPMVKRIALRLATILSKMQQSKLYSLDKNPSADNLADSVFSILLFLVLKDNDPESCISAFVDLLFLAKPEMVQMVTNSDHFVYQFHQLLDEFIRGISCYAITGDFRTLHVQASLLTCITLKNRNIALICVQKSAHEHVVSFVKSILSDSSRIEQDSQVVLLMVSCTQFLCCVEKGVSSILDKSLRGKLVSFFAQKSVGSLGFAVFVLLVDTHCVIDTDPGNDTYFDTFYLCQDYILGHTPMTDIACITMSVILSRTTEEARSILMQSWWNLDMCIQSILFADSCSIIYLWLTLNLLRYNCEWQAELVATLKLRKIYIIETLSNGIDRLLKLANEEKGDNRNSCFESLQAAKKLHILNQILMKLVDNVEYLNQIIPKCISKDMMMMTSPDLSTAYSWKMISDTNMTCLMPSVE